jgi:hypothetical protein
MYVLELGATKVVDPETDYSDFKARNLSERIKIPQLIEALREIFEEYGTIVDIVAKSSLKRKGQAFIVFDSVQSAENAIDEVNGFELFGQSMSLDFARTRSDATVQREGTSEDFEQHKRHRKAEKGEFVNGRGRVLNTDEPEQSASKPSKQPKQPRTLNDQHQVPPNQKLLLNAPPRQHVEQDLREHQALAQESYRTNTYRLTRFCSSDKCPRTTESMPSQPSSRALLASRRSVLCLDARALLSSSMKPRTGLSAPKRPQQACRWVIIPSESRSSVNRGMLVLAICTLAW